MKVFSLNLYDYFGLAHPEGAEGELFCYLPDTSREVNPARRHPAILCCPAVDTPLPLTGRRSRLPFSSWPGAIRPLFCVIPWLLPVFPPSSVRLLWPWPISAGMPLN